MANRDELTLDEAFADPLIQALMRADKVDRARLRTEWASLISPLAMRTPGASSRPAAEGPFPGLPAGWDELVRDCLCQALKDGAAGGATRRAGTR
jgi:hypothetical protein